ncbi:FAD/FMN-containing dehydrogenase [Haloactinospora alba]|uniref:FAD/FMN-containing dehydrogenase n=2 Tax=Haloactinospora alba TaxID=405555 RepID=A0A543NIJ5_9ACTN|nr:FAD/FMN-containing dehydrogenase [Haloactinospora alba]
MLTASETLSRHVRGRVRTPGPDGGDTAGNGFQLLAPHRPTTVVEAAGPGDVGAAVGFAADHGCRVAVQATGHGRGTAMRGGVLIDTHRLCGVRVDPHRRSAWVEAGTRWQHVIDAAAPYGLAPLSGSFPGVGAVSYTLGGGVGLLARRYGFAADHVTRLEVVTATGRSLRVSAHEEPDLFWALRGGGGSFGIVTGMEISLVPVERIYGGALFFDVDRTPGVLDGWCEWTSTVPEEMTSAATVLPFPDLPTVPEPLRGRHVAQLQVSYVGSTESGKRLVEPLRGLGPVLRDTLRELPYSESATVFDEPDQPHAYRGENILLDGPDRQELSTLLQRTGPSAPAMCVVGIRHLGGALGRTPWVPNAVGHRNAAYSLGVLSPVESGNEDSVRGIHRRLLALFAPRTLGRSLNFTFGGLGADQVRSAFAPADYQRLRRIRAGVDPTGLFHVAHPIPPQESG